MAQRNNSYPVFVIDDRSETIVYHDLFDNDEYENSSIFLRRIFRELVSEMFRIYKENEGEIDNDEFYVEYSEQLSEITNNIVSDMSKSDKNIVIAEYGVDYAYKKINEESDIDPDISISNQFVFVCLSEDIGDLDKLVKDTVEVMLSDTKYKEYRIMFEN
jgi:hypothetical protein